MTSIWEKPVSHGEMLKRIWKHLDLGVIQSKHPFHTPVFGTSFDGNPETRVVVLRRFWRRPPRLAFHTHAGSPKISHIKENPSVSWVFYHPEEKFQARIQGTAAVHVDDELADEQWEATSLFARRCYMGEAPSQLSKKPTHGLPESLVDAEPSVEESGEGRKNFVVISSSIESIDYLELDVKGHRRSLFKWTDGDLEMKWLTP